ncbi:MAG: response regulator [Sulfurimonas sp.]|jgi:YesN/AraC family two-component response regulator
MKQIIEEIKQFSGNMSLLYVEDNAGLRENVEKLLGKVFNNVIAAEDGEDGYNAFVKFKPSILITDLNMPKMNGSDMIKKIKANEPECKIIILSAYNEKEHLHNAINLGVFRYLSKPAKVPELVQAIYDSVIAIHKEENHRLFLSQIQTIFNYQNNIVIMMHEGKFILSNKRFLEFFKVDDLESFTKKYSDMDGLLLEHKDFLYTTPESKWYDTAVANSGKLFHTKIKNYKGEMRHLILKSRDIPEKDGRSILSFDDVTELNLMGLFDSDTTNSDATRQDKEAILTFMKIVKDNSAEVKIHNYYKGLTIVNSAVISEITNDEVTLKTSYPQLKIIKFSEVMTVSSEIFPKSVICKSIKSVDLDNQTVVINQMSFAPRSAVDRKFIRLEPEEKHGCSLFYKEIKVAGDVKIIDIAEVSIKIEINALFPGMRINEIVKISINLTLHSRLISIVTDATIYRIDENLHSYYVTMLFTLDINNTRVIKEYLASRQMALIREFKKMDSVMAPVSEVKKVGTTCNEYHI